MAENAETPRGSTGGLLKPIKKTSSSTHEDSGGLRLPEVADRPMLDAALAYAGAGVPVFPLQPRSKKPVIDRGFLNATCDESQIREWWESVPQANIGTVPGLIGCIIPDLDTEEAIEAWQRRVPLDTAQSRTGSGHGLHPWYKVPQGLAGRTHWRTPKYGFLDEPALGNLLWRASGGYVVLPPSIHPDTGRPYVLESQGPISLLPNDIAELLRECGGREAGESRPVNTSEAAAWLAEHSTAKTSETGESAIRETVKAITTAAPGVRNETLIEQVGVLLNRVHHDQIDLDEARERIAEAYRTAVGGDRNARTVEREIDHAFAYVASQRVAEDPPIVSGGYAIRIGVDVILSEPAPKPSSSWAAVDLKSALDDPPKAEILLRLDGQALLYRDRMHWIMGESEGMKTWLALCAVEEVLSDYGRVIFIDFEDHPGSIVRRLEALGLNRSTLEDPNRFVYLRPDEPIEQGRDDLDRLLAPGADLVILDGVTEAMVAEDLEPDSNSDVAKWIKRVVRPVVDLSGAAVVCIDHVTKNRDNRGKFAIGGQHKRAAVDGAAYMVEVIHPVAPVSTGTQPRDGLASIKISKDRNGDIRKASPEGYAGSLEMSAFPDGSITWRITQRGIRSDHALRLRVAELLRGSPGATKRDVRSLGNSNTFDQVVAGMIADGLVTVTPSGSSHRHYLTTEGEKTFPAPSGGAS